jgi:ketohexokinase
LSNTHARVPFFPPEDTKLRATSLSVRRGGNCPNSLEVLVQLLDQRNEGGGSGSHPAAAAEADADHDVHLHLISTLPERSSAAAQKILGSFADAQHRISFDRCLFRAGCTEAASSYIIRSEASGTRTLVNYNDLPEMTGDELVRIVDTFAPEDEYIFHFEGRVTDAALACVHAIRERLPRARISVECEKPGRPGLPELAAEADIVFYSQHWATSRGYSFAEHCLKHETRPKA